jgi:hypothetical protein
MSRHAFLFGLFCIAIVSAFTFAMTSGYSPFANGGARGFAHGSYGPTHK